MKITTNGLKIFLYVLLGLIKEGKKESCKTIEKKLSTGIATYLYYNYQNVFDNYGFNPDNIDDINEYYKDFINVADGNENRKYFCDTDDGLYLLFYMTLD